MKLSSCMLQTFTVINISIYDCTSPWETCPESASNSVPFSAINLSIYCCTFPWKTCPKTASKSVQKRAQKLPRNLCKLSNKYQYLLLYLPLENVPRNYLEICAKTCPEITSKSVQKRAQKLPRNLCKNVPRNYLEICANSAVRPSINGGCTFLGFRALDSLEIVPFMHLLLLSSLQATPWNSSLFKLFSLECVPKNEISCTLFTLLGLFSWLFTFYGRD